MVISRAIVRVTPFRALLTLLITYLLSPLPLQASFRGNSGGLQRLRGKGSFGVRGVQGVSMIYRS